MLIARYPLSVDLVLVGQDFVLDLFKHCGHPFVVLANVVAEALPDFVNPEVEGGDLDSGVLVLQFVAEESEIVLEHLKSAGQGLHQSLDLINRLLRYHNGVGRCFVVFVCLWLLKSFIAVGNIVASRIV